MIRGVHTMFYSDDAEALRAFLRDKLGFAATDVGGGWLIFDLPAADMGVHPTEPAAAPATSSSAATPSSSAPSPPAPTGPPAGTHNISFYCDDVRQTVAELSARGVEFVDAVTDMGYGLATHFKLPGCGTAQLYQPLYRKNQRLGGG